MRLVLTSSFHVLQNVGNLKEVHEVSADVMPEVARIEPHYPCNYFGQNLSFRRKIQKRQCGSFMSTALVFLFLVSSCNCMSILTFLLLLLLLHFLLQAWDFGFRMIPSVGLMFQM